MARETDADLPEDFAEVIFDAQGPIPLHELADSFLALDRMFVRESRQGLRLAVTEIRKGSIVALLAPYLPFLGQTVGLVSSCVDVADFIKRLRSGLDAFAGFERASAHDLGSTEGDVAAELAELVKPLAGRAGSTLGVAHIRISSKTAKRTVHVEATYGSAEIDRIAINAARVKSEPAAALAAPQVDAPPTLLRDVVLAFHQANTGPAKQRGKTGDRGVIEAVTEKPLPVYFATTSENLKLKMVGRTANPLRQPFRVDVLVDFEGQEPRGYTVIEVHGPERGTSKKPSVMDLLTTTNRKQLIAPGRQGTTRKPKTKEL